MKINEAEFVGGSDKLETIPDLNYPEIAFAGRSNVGKSSLLNSIVHRKNLARISSTPGKTRQLNFFVVDNMWSFADMPGFGYAAVSKTQRAHWIKLVYGYLESRKNLKLVCCLIDSRHDPMDNDLALIEWLENHGKNFVIIMTKCDKISKPAVAERKEQIEQLILSCSYCSEVLPYSAVTDLGRKELHQIIKKYSTDK